jgi:acetolactate synthase-1/2/3 large subunit
MRDERSAAYAADGYARISGRVGVCDATVGPGAIKFVSGLGEALNSSSPVVAVMSDMESDWLAVRERGGGNQIVDQRSILKPVCKWVGRLPNAEKTAELVQRAFQMASTGRPGPAVIELPEDLFRASHEAATPDVDSRFGCVPALRPGPNPDSIREAMSLLEAADRPVIIAGGGVWLSNAGEQLTALAEHLAVPVATTLSGKGVIPDTHPLSLGVLGALGGTTMAKQVVEDADVVIAVGFKFGQNPTYKWTLPTASPTIIHIDIDPAEIGKIVPTRVGIVADARLALSAMLDAAGPPRSRSAVEAHMAKQRVEWQAYLDSSAEAASPIKPQQVMKLINELAGPDDILVSDASFSCGWGAMYFDVRDNRRAIFPRGLAGLGWGLPAAIGAQIARPESHIIVLAGDGAMTFCLGELASLSQHGLNIKVVVLNNSTMGWIKWDQATFWDGRFQSTDLNRVNFALAARALGCEGIEVSDPSDLRDSLAKALATEAPVVIDVHTSVDETPVAKFNQSENAKAHIQGRRE